MKFHDVLLIPFPLLARNSFTAMHFLSRRSLAAALAER